MNMLPPAVPQPRDMPTQATIWVANWAANWVAMGVIAAAMLMPPSVAAAADKATSAKDAAPADGGARPSFPGKGAWATIAPAKAGWDAETIEAALDYAMSQKSSGVVIVHGGKLMAERHATVKRGSLSYRFMVKGKTTAGHSIEDVASVQKSVVSVLAGIAQEKGLLKLDDPVSRYLGPGWSKATRDQEAKITLRHLLSMSSGLNARLRYAAPPATKWQYNNAAYARCLMVIAAAAKMSNNELTERWLTGPLNMQDTRWVKRPGLGGGNPVGLATTARDLARFGHMVLAHGQWNDKPVLGDRDYLKASLSPSQKMNPAYGYLWWLNGHKAVRPISRPTNRWLAPDAPKDMVAALGKLGRKCYVIPSLDLVVTRLGDNPEASFDDTFWKKLLAGAPKRGGAAR